MTNQEYRALPDISNTDLTAFKRMVFGEYHHHRLPTKAFSFGDLFHKAILQPKALTTQDFETLDAKQLQLLIRLLNKVRSEIPWLLRWITKQKVYTWTDATTEAKCKMRLDANLRRQTIVEFKTTSAHNLPEFLETVDEYDYDRQIAFYKDGFDTIYGTDCKVLLVILSKVAPFNLMVYQPSGEMLKRGRKKYKRLLKDMVKKGINPTHWINDFDKEYPF